MSRRGWVLFAAMCVIWGIPYLLIRVAVRDVPPGTPVFLRTTIGGLVLLPLALRAAASARCCAAGGRSRAVPATPGAGPEDGTLRWRASRASGNAG